MHGGWNYYPPWLYSGPEWSHWSHERLIADQDALNGKMVVRKLWYNASPTASYGCHLYPRVSAFVSTDGDLGRAALPAGAPTAQWNLEVDKSQTVKDDFSVSDQTVLFKGVVTFAPSVGHHVYVQSSLDVKVETSGMDYTPYFTYMGLQLTNLRIVQRANRRPSP